MSTKHNLLYSHKGNENLSHKINPHLCPRKAAMDKWGAERREHSFALLVTAAAQSSWAWKRITMLRLRMRQEKLLCKFTFDLELRVRVLLHLASAYFSVPGREVCRNPQSFTHFNFSTVTVCTSYLLFIFESEQGGKYPAVQTAAELRSNPTSRLLYFPHHNI